MTDPNWPAYTPEEQLRRTLRNLPPIARQKYNALVAASADAEALMRVCFERQAPLKTSFADIKRRMAYVDQKIDPDGYRVLSEELETVRSELMRLDSERSARDGVRANCDQILAQLRDRFLVAGLSWPLRAVTVDAKPNKGETLTDALQRTRTAILTAKHELMAVKQAPPSIEELGHQLWKAVNEHATAPAIIIYEGKLRINWPDVVEYAPKGSTLAAPSGSASRLLCWLFRDQMLEALTKSIEWPRNGLSAEERAQRLTDLDARIMRLEHEEEAFVTAALAQGIVCERRPYASGWALLGIEPGDPPVAALQAAE